MPINKGDFFDRLAAALLKKPFDEKIIKKLLDDLEENKMDFSEEDNKFLISVCKNSKDRAYEEQGFLIFLLLNSEKFSFSTEAIKQAAVYKDSAEKAFWNHEKLLTSEEEKLNFLKKHYNPDKNKQGQSYYEQMLLENRGLFEEGQKKHEESPRMIKIKNKIREYAPIERKNAIEKREKLNKAIYVFLANNNKVEGLESSLNEIKNSTNKAEILQYENGLNSNEVPAQRLFMSLSMSNSLTVKPNGSVYLYVIKIFASSPYANYERSFIEFLRNECKDKIFKALKEFLQKMAIEEDLDAAIGFLKNICNQDAPGRPSIFEEIFSVNGLIEQSDYSDEACMLGKLAREIKIYEELKVQIENKEKFEGERIDITEEMEEGKSEEKIVGVEELRNILITRIGKNKQTEFDRLLKILSQKSEAFRDFVLFGIPRAYASYVPKSLGIPVLLALKENIVTEKNEREKEKLYRYLVKILSFHTKEYQETIKDFFEPYTISKNSDHISKKSLLKALFDISDELMEHAEKWMEGYKFLVRNFNPNHAEVRTLLEEILLIKRGIIDVTYDRGKFEKVRKKIKLSYLIVKEILTKEIFELIEQIKLYIFQVSLSEIKQKVDLNNELDKEMLFAQARRIGKELEENILPLPETREALVKALPTDLTKITLICIAPDLAQEITQHNPMSKIATIVRDEVQKEMKERKNEPSAKVSDRLSIQTLILLKTMKKIDETSAFETLSEKKRFKIEKIPQDKVQKNTKKFEAFVKK